MTETPLDSLDCGEATAPELAAAVVSYIEEHGWRQGELGHGASPVCLVGGIAAVCSGGPQFGYQLLSFPPSAVLHLAEALMDDGVIPVRILEMPDGSRFLDHTTIYRFNDREGQTMNGALNPLRRVAGLPEVNE